MPMHRGIESGHGGGACWVLIAVWVGVTLTSLFAPQWVSPDLSRYLTLALMIAFTFLHGARRYGASGCLVYFVLAITIANVFENLSIVSGFPFGQYHHTAAMGPRFLHVPLIVGPIFAVVGYLGWVLAGILLGDAQRESRRGLLLAQPLVAAFITTSWDLCVDPIGGTLKRDWVWLEGGGYFGVPWQNFFGWMLTMWLIFQLFAVFLGLWSRISPTIRSRAYWLQPIVFWALIALQFPLIFALAPDAAVSDPAGTPWRASHLLESMAIVSVFTMLFTALLGLCALNQQRR